MTRRMLASAVVSVVAEAALLAVWLRWGVTAAAVVLGAIIIAKIELLALTTPNWPPWAAPGEHSRWRPHL